MPNVNENCDTVPVAIEATGSQGDKNKLTTELCDGNKATAAKGDENDVHVANGVSREKYSEGYKNQSAIEQSDVNGAKPSDENKATEAKGDENDVPAANGASNEKD